MNHSPETEHEINPIRVDAHHHLWHYSATEYGWISDGMRKIRRDFEPPDIAHELQAAGLDASVVVQARQTLAETEWLLDLADDHPFIRGVVGWVPLCEGAALEKSLDALTGRQKLKAVRHVIHDEPDDAFILRDDFNRGIERLGPYGLVYDLLIFEKHLPQTIAFVDRHPQQPFVLDHIGKPRIRDRALTPWREQLTELARRENVWCKLSGVLTEADWDGWREQDIARYLEIVLEIFGPERLLFGSDWPVLLLAAPYREWVNLVHEVIGALSTTEQQQIMGGNATRVYRL